jgi:hypothetical protein
LAVGVLVLSGTSTLHAKQLVAYDMDTNTGAQVTDVSGLAPAINPDMQAAASFVVDATRPGAAPGNIVLSVGNRAAGDVGATTAEGLPELEKLNTTGSMTIAAWMKGTSTGGFRQVFGRGWLGERLFNFANGVPEGEEGGEDLGYAISNSEAGGFQFAVIDTTPNVNDGEWHHAAFSFDADAKTITFYYDGVAQPVIPVIYGARNPIGGGNGIGIGARYDQADQLDDWLIDDAIFWTGAANPALMEQIGTGQISGIDVANIPEPATCVMLVIGACLLVCRRRS